MVKLCSFNLRQTISAVLMGLAIPFGLACPVIIAATPVPDTRPSEAPAQADSDYEAGMKAYSARDYKTAFPRLLRAAENGNAEAQHQVGEMFDYGEGVAKNSRQASEWYLKAAEQGGESGAAAQILLGNMFNFGRGVPKDAWKAAEWYRKAADQGNPAGESILADCYADGIGVPQSDSAALDYYFKAAVAFLKSGRREQALVNYDAMRKIDPQHPLVEQLKQQLYAAPPAGDGTNEKPEEAATVLGTGWPIAGGYVVTDFHVVSGANKITLVRTDGTKISAIVAAKDAVNDLALLKVQDASSLPNALPLAAALPAIGEAVFTVGYPHPDVMGLKPKLTNGTISASSGIDDDPRMVQISAAVQAGNSGGPLLNSKGEVVGVVEAKLKAMKIFEATGDLPENVAYAVKVGYLKPLLDSVPANQKAAALLPSKEAPLPDLAKRIEGSILLVVCE